jgi:hypothetical protein
MLLDLKSRPLSLACEPMQWSVGRVHRSSCVHHQVCGQVQHHHLEFNLDLDLAALGDRRPLHPHRWPGCVSRQLPAAACPDPPLCPHSLPGAPPFRAGLPAHPCTASVPPGGRCYSVPVKRNGGERSGHSAAGAGHGPEDECGCAAVGSEDAGVRAGPHLALALQR